MSTSKRIRMKRLKRGLILKKKFDITDSEEFQKMMEEQLAKSYLYINAEGIAVDASTENYFRRMSEIPALNEVFDHDPEMDIDDPLDDYPFDDDDGAVAANHSFNNEDALADGEENKKWYKELFYQFPTIEVNLDDITELRAAYIDGELPQFYSHWIDCKVNQRKLPKHVRKIKLDYEFIENPTIKGSSVQTKPLYNFDIPQQLQGGVIPRPVLAWAA